MSFLSILQKEFPKGRVDLFPPLIKYSLVEKSKLRLAHFYAQLAHESDGFKTLEEYASGSAYEGRLDLGNTSAGDGKKYKGRGYIQITGRYNYAAAGNAMKQDLMTTPTLLLTPELGFEASLWYWKVHQLDKLADADNITAITKKINGGYNGLLSRIQYLKIFKRIL